MVDEKGYYLVHPDPAREWGGPLDLDTGQGAFADYAPVWADIATHEEGIISPAPGNWGTTLLETLAPLGLIPAEEQQSRRVLVYHQVQPAGVGYIRWWLLYDVPRVNLFASVSAFRLTAVIILLTAVIAALLMAIGLARNLTAPILRLTADVRRFSQGRIGRAIRASKLLSHQDEISELTAAFQEMSAALDQHLRQLSLLNRAVHHISARLERPEVLEAVATAANRLFPVKYLSITLDEELAYTSGDPAWAAHREQDTVQAVLHATI